MKSFAKLVAVGLPVLTVCQETWQSHLTPKELKKLGSDLDYTQKKAKHEEYYAQQDAKDHPEEVTEMQQEYAQKMAGVLKKYKQMATDNAEGAAGLALMLAANPAPVDLDASNWMVKLTPEAQEQMHHALSDLKKQGEHDLSLAKEDVHPKEVHAKLESYAAKVSDVVKKFKKKAGAEDVTVEQDFVSSEVLSLASSWLSSLSAPERAELNKELSKNQKDGKIQLKYAKEYGQRAVTDQETETRKEEHEILMRFEKKHSPFAVAQELASTSSSSVTPIMASAVGMAAGGIVTAFIVAGRNWRRESTEPLISPDYQVIV